MKGDIDPKEVAAVQRYYSQALKKHQRRLNSLDARGVCDERRVETWRSIAKYKVVLEALNLLRTEGEQP